MSRFSDACDRGYDGQSPSEEMIARARRRDSEICVMGVDPCDDEPEELPTYKELEFDVAYYKKRFQDEVMHHHKDCERYKSEIARLEAKIMELEAK